MNNLLQAIQLWRTKMYNRIAERQMRKEVEYDGAYGLCRSTVWRVSLTTLAGWGWVWQCVSGRTCTRFHPGSRQGLAGPTGTKPRAQRIYQRSAHDTSGPSSYHPAARLWHQYERHPLSGHGICTQWNLAPPPSTDQTGAVRDREYLRYRHCIGLAIRS